MLPTIVETVAHALKLPFVAIAIKNDDRLTSGVEYGEPVGALVILPLIYQSELVGELRVSPRGPEESFTEADKHLLEDIAHQTGIAVHATRLTADLRRSAPSWLPRARRSADGCAAIYMMVLGRRSPA